MTARPVAKFQRRNMAIIEQKNVRYKCNFCGDLFLTASECAKHIEGKSWNTIKIGKKRISQIFPNDIILVDITKEKRRKTSSRRIRR
jgi:hypothetical protein